MSTQSPSALENNESARDSRLWRISSGDQRWFKEWRLLSSPHPGIEECLSPGRLAELATRPTLLVDFAEDFVVMSPAFLDKFAGQGADRTGAVGPLSISEESCLDLVEILGLIRSPAARQLQLSRLQANILGSADLRLPVTILVDVVINERTNGQLFVLRFLDPNTEPLTRAEILCKELVKITDELGAHTLGITAGASTAFRTLSVREREVAEMMLDGLRTSEIAQTLSISPHTARNHLKAIFRKLGVHSQVAFLRQFRLPGRA